MISEVKTQKQTLQRSSRVLGGEPSRAVLRASTGLYLRGEETWYGIHWFADEKVKEICGDFQDKNREFWWVLFEQAFDLPRFMLNSGDYGLRIVGFNELPSSCHFFVTVLWSFRAPIWCCKAFSFPKTVTTRLSCRVVNMILWAFGPTEIWADVQFWTHLSIQGLYLKDEPTQCP